MEKAKDASIVGILVGTLGVGMSASFLLSFFYCSLSFLFETWVNFISKSLNSLKLLFVYVVIEAGYLHIIQQMKELIEGAGKKSYTLVMGRPTSHKLANFPEV